MYKKAIIALALIGSASLIGHLYVQSQVYYPVVRINMPEGLTFAAVLPETKERKACGAANDRFLAPFRQCKECKIAVARCERELDGFELSLKQGAALPYPTVVAREARVAILGPAEPAKQSCQVAAATMVAKGFRSATCIPAQAAPAKS